MNKNQQILNKMVADTQMCPRNGNGCNCQAPSGDGIQENVVGTALVHSDTVEKRFQQKHLKSRRERNQTIKMNKENSSSESSSEASTVTVLRPPLKKRSDGHDFTQTKVAEPVGDGGFHTYSQGASTSHVGDSLPPIYTAFDFFGNLDDTEFEDIASPDQVTLKKKASQDLQLDESSSETEPLPVPVSIKKKNSVRDKTPAALSPANYPSPTLSDLYGDLDDILYTSEMEISPAKKPSEKVQDEISSEIESVPVPMKKKKTDGIQNTMGEANQAELNGNKKSTDQTQQHQNRNENENLVKASTSAEAIAILRKTNANLNSTKADATDSSTLPEASSSINQEHWKKRIISKKKIIFNDNKTKTKQRRISRSDRAGVKFSVSRLHRNLKQQLPSCRISNKASIYLAGVFDYLVSEVFFLGTDIARIHKRKRIIPQTIEVVFRCDQEFAELCKDVIIANGGSGTARLVQDMNDLL